MEMSKCWDCKRAIGGCSWSDSLLPVKGWVAKEIKPTSSKSYSTYMVQDCPDFVRDAYEHGTRRKPREIKL